MRTNKVSNKNKLAFAILFAIAFLLFTILPPSSFIPPPSVFASENETPPPNEPSLTVVFNEFLRPNGSFTTTLSFSVDVGNEDGQETLNSVNALLAQVAAAYSAVGFPAEISGTTVNVVIAQHRNLTRLSIANGRTGYDAPSVNNNVQRGVFFNKVTTVRVNPFTSWAGFINVGKDAIVNSEIFENLTTTYIFNYGTKYQNFSSNADAVVKVSDEHFFIHQFVMNEGETNREIIITVTNPHAAVWYAFAAGAAVLASIVIIILAKKVKSEK
jgi:hypothetical protein